MTAPPPDPAPPPPRPMTDDELALYDRQLRVWGVDAQRR